VCQAELEELRKLSALLQESPAPETLTQPERFVAQVALRLPRRPTQPAWKRTLEAGWRLAPVGLLGVWAFVEAANFARRYHEPAKRFYERKKARTNNVVATKALAHKLARACYHILKEGKPFDVARCFG
jgi:hypothetical protein